MGMNMNAYVPENGDPKVLTFVEGDKEIDQNPLMSEFGIRLTQLLRKILHQSLNIDFGPGSFRITPEEMKGAYHKIQAYASIIIFDSVVDVDTYQALEKFFKVCLLKGYYIAAG